MQKSEYFVAVCFSSPARHRKANEPVNPFTGWHLQSKWGFTGRIPGRNAPIMEKGMFQMHFIGISLGCNKYFLFIVSLLKEESCLLIWAFMAVDLCQYFGQKKSKDYAAFLSSSSSFC